MQSPVQQIPSAQSPPPGPDEPQAPLYIHEDQRTPWQKFLAALPPFVKRPWFIAVVAVVAVTCLVLLVALRPREPEPEVALPQPEELLPPPFEVSQEKATRSADLRFAGTPPELPRSLRVYRYSGVEKSLTEEESLNLASQFAFRTDPETVEDAKYGKFYLWSRRDETLVIKPALRTVSYTNFRREGAEEVPEASEFETAASRYLRNKGLLHEYLTLSESKTTYLQDDASVWKSISGPVGADAVSVGFNYQIGGVSLVGEYFGSDPVTLILDLEKKVIGVEYTVFDVSRLRLLDEYPAKSFEAALGEVQGGESLMLVADGAQFAGEELVDLSGAVSGVLSTIEVAYFMPDTGVDILQPVYVFSGTGQVGTTRRQFQIYIPAISSEYF